MEKRLAAGTRSYITAANLFGQPSPTTQPPPPLPPQRSLLPIKHPMMLFVGNLLGWRVRDAPPTSIQCRRPPALLVRTSMIRARITSSRGLTVYHRYVALTLTPRPVGVTQRCAASVARSSTRRAPRPRIPSKLYVPRRRRQVIAGKLRNSVAIGSSFAEIGYISGVNFVGMCTVQCAVTSSRFMFAVRLLQCRATRSGKGFVSQKLMPARRSAQNVRSSYHLAVINRQNKLCPD